MGHIGHINKIVRLPSVICIGISCVMWLYCHNKYHIRHHNVYLGWYIFSDAMHILCLAVLFVSRIANKYMDIFRYQDTYLLVIHWLVYAVSSPSVTRCPLNDISMMGTLTLCYRRRARELSLPSVVEIIAYRLFGAKENEKFLTM